MTERPILFSGAMVRAILDGRKTITRRTVKTDLACNLDEPRGQADIEAGYPYVETENGYAPLTDLCPYGQRGDRLWVREAWVADAQVDAIAPRDLSQGEPIMYPADGAIRQTGCTMVSQGKGRPSIHMPRWASRILLEITAVRVERLQDISEQQALAEGVKGEPCDHARQACANIGCWGDTAKGAFGFLWESLNGAGSWAANPWVWVVEFKRVTP